MERTFKIFRFDPRRDQEPRYREYAVAVQQSDRILDCLNRIRWEQDPSLSFRMSCAHGVCGSDGMRINGVCALACQRLVKDYKGDEPILIEPLPSFPVAKDLVVDLEAFFEKYRSVLPYLQPGDDVPEGERIQSPEERRVFDEAIRCILCGCCTAACPISGEEGEFVGPAALLRTFRFLFDSRDGAQAERIRRADHPHHAHGCKTHWERTKVCPKEIPVTKSIGRIKMAVFQEKKKKG